MGTPCDTLDDVRFSELVSEGSDIPGIADRLKSIAAAERDQGRDTTVDELLAQSRHNDAAYLMPSDIEKAEWVADLYEREDRPNEHARDFHYRLVRGSRSLCWVECSVTTIRSRTSPVRPPSGATAASGPWRRSTSRVSTGCPSGHR